jgi:hypothetical protein
MGMVSKTTRDEDSFPVSFVGDPTSLAHSRVRRTPRRKGKTNPLPFVSFFRPTHGTAAGKKILSCCFLYLLPVLQLTLNDHDGSPRGTIHPRAQAPGPSRHRQGLCDGPPIGVPVRPSRNRKIFFGGAVVVDDGRSSPSRTTPHHSSCCCGRRVPWLILCHHRRM